ncbi:DUF4359 domain-containing protein [Thermosynechococcus sp. GLH187]|uniref:DUF4359 domain-containing protein n=1 Tax=unclassified Thermosynechococcus TaxID=2622553 RepID=UPI0028775FEA|nr:MULTISPECIES: DUF4359 domain-containing protein [unclassified Thermosynechococcus]WNC45824.1 DUF4359 domain-containing protein [Thermosynechococcus sp. GLH187]WNC48360.1 DUF4359 domain-containing protein [Thermosynechococcus sp. GLH333]WNC50893.1 DUF4359 domain-containing protein [Thermosynechococcus sp. GLH87]
MKVPLLSQVMARPLWWGGGAFLLLGIIAAVLTNPTPADYQRRAAAEINTFLLTQVCPEIINRDSAIAQVALEVCDQLESRPAEDIERYIAYNTQSYNLGVATLFVTELPIDTVWSLGLFGQIIPLTL